MGFEVNFNPKPIITETKGLTDGGAGNLGYFEQDKEKKEKERDKSVFAETNTEDSFSKEGDENVSSPEEFSISGVIADIIFSVKEWFKKTFNLK